jgi:hypothetical protein
MLTNALGVVTASTIEGSAHLVQLALTPVFLLTAIAGFLNVFTGRLARVADRVNGITRLKLEGKPVMAGLSANLTSLRRRTLALQGAVVLAGVSGAFTCAATFTIFLGALGADQTSMLLFVEFGLALVSLLGGLTCFVAEMLIASRAMIAQIASDR